MALTPEDFAETPIMVPLHNGFTYRPVEELVAEERAARDLN